MTAYRQGDTILYYEARKVWTGDSREEVVYITGAGPCEGQLVIPGDIDGYVVYGIGKKAFLGSHITAVVIPGSVREMEDWAFAQCAALKNVFFESETAECTLGKGVFDDCVRIQNIFLRGRGEKSLAALFATLPVKLSGEHLMTAGDVGSTEWFAKYDARLVAFLREDNHEGYTTLVLCGEEDIMRSPDGYVSDKIMRKAALCFTRLMHDKYLDEETRKIYTDYILSYNKGCVTDEAWQALLSEFGDDIEYFRLFTDMGGVTADNLDEILVDMEDKNAEAKAYLIKYRQSKLCVQDAFSMFQL